MAEGGWHDESAPHWKGLIMNRIYQGKVTAVEIPDGKDESGKPKWKRLDDWQSALGSTTNCFRTT
jgi:hypothetical protein